MKKQELLIRLKIILKWMNSCIQRKKLEIVKSLRMQNRKGKEDSAFHLICYAVHYARNKKENK